MTVSVDLGQTDAGAPALLDLEELLATRLLVQGNSGSGKSHLLRRLLEQRGLGAAGGDRPGRRFRHPGGPFRPSW